MRPEYLDIAKAILVLSQKVFVSDPNGAAYGAHEKAMLAYQAASQLAQRGGHVLATREILAMIADAGDAVANVLDARGRFQVVKHDWLTTISARLGASS